MSTNYYAKAKPCACCGVSNPEHERHIGKSAVGWLFIWQGFEDIRSIADWKDYIKRHNLEIYDEYDRLIDTDEFFGEIANDEYRYDRIKEDCGTEPMHDVQLYPDGWLSPEGASFSIREFS